MSYKRCPICKGFRQVESREGLCDSEPPRWILCKRCHGRGDIEVDDDDHSDLDLLKIACEISEYCRETSCAVLAVPPQGIVNILRKYLP